MSHVLSCLSRPIRLGSDKIDDCRIKLRQAINDSVGTVLILELVKALLLAVGYLGLDMDQISTTKWMGLVTTLGGLWSPGVRSESIN